ncbi:hypothetical protein AB1Y20_000527 [Prymnesium parvum]|uniref:Cation-transporting ATPase n=1 Tax=Prymnesium parvum TaxID=97485 RepID=A0AB34KAP0_PRYPA
MSVSAPAHPKWLKEVTIHENQPARRALLAALFMLGYALAIGYCISTAGEPYAAAVLERARLDNASNATNATNATSASSALPAAVEAALHVPPNAALPTAGDGGFGDEDWGLDDEFGRDGTATQPPAAPPPLGNSSNSTFTPTPRPLPHEWLPNALACALLFLHTTVHALFYLMCHWSVDFKKRALFSVAKTLQPGCYLCFKPLAHKGRAAIVRAVRSPLTQQLTCEFQRQKFEILPAEDVRARDDAAQHARLADAAYVVTLIRCPDTLARTAYRSSTGLATEAEVKERAEQFGENMLSVPTPRFLDLYIEQLLSPLAMFQIFTSVLWLLDSVSIGFSVFQVCTILLLESTSVFQRQKTLKTLNQMSTKPYQLYIYRTGRWEKRSTTSILPGDLISLTPPKLPSAPAAGTAPAKDGGSNDVVPCDCVLLRGSAVANEASLTGESVPQMKDALGGEKGDQPLDVHGADRVSVLFAGTTLITVAQAGAAKEASNGGVPPTPDGGCLCFVLRAGFSSAQGELMQMIEFSQQKVGDDSRETLLALFILLCFALVASAYVFKRGLEKGDRTTHELLLKCVIIITSVVPRSLPMQTAMAVNTALMALMKAGIFCTEPYRVPFAGKIDSVLFDKTGTLTTDQLVPVKIVNADSPNERQVSDAGTPAAVVLAGCHSLISIAKEGALLGDPIETAALAGVKWRYDHSSQTAFPGDTTDLSKRVHALKMKLEPPPLAEGVPAPAPPSATDAEKMKKEIEATQKTIKEITTAAERSDVKSVRILHRHHFSSALQRMSTLASVTNRSGGQEIRCLVKGSPEAVGRLLSEGGKPAWYDQTHRSMAERGMRVLALASKRVDEQDEAAAVQLPRDAVEAGLSFVGFVAFACKTRSDSKAVVTALLDSAHAVTMLTGDAPLTALHVAREVGICAPSADERAELLLACEEGGAPRWVRAVGGSDETVLPFDVAILHELAKEYDLMATDASIEAAAAVEPQLWSKLDVFKVFARMSPQGKAKVIRMLQERNGRRVLMCGDGGNDVGALKQSDVGLALLSGYGNVNTSDLADPSKASGGGGKQAEEALNAQAKELARKQAESAKIQREALKKKQKELQAMQQVWLKEEMDRRLAAGEDVGVMAQMRILKTTLGRVHSEMMAERQRLAAIHGNVYDSKEGASKLLAEVPADTDMPMVRPGDASVAAPFTSRSPSVRNIVDLIRQGRCTLLSALQQQQIMMLESTISAFVLSALSLEGARSSERQMMASSWLLMIASLAFSYATPIDKMHPERPLKSLFHPAIFFSMFGQAVIHLAAMYTAVHMARAEMGPDKLVVEFHRKDRLREQRELDAQKAMDEGDYMASFLSMWMAPFMPNLLNTCVFLVETAQCVAVLLVNYKGRPWMKGITENHALFLSVFACVVGCAACAWGVFPELNKMIHLEAFPDDAFRFKVMGLVGLSLAGTFIWDRLCCAIFAPRIFQATLDEAKALTIADAVPAIKSLVKVFAVMMIFSSGNILIWGGAYYMYKQYNNAQAEAERLARERNAA